LNWEHFDRLSTIDFARIQRQRRATIPAQRVHFAKIQRQRRATIPAQREALGIAIGC
jgi:hypothetical protein